jgi:hypothetical protein
VTEIRGATVLPAKRTPVTLPTADGLRLVGELALPADAEPVATLICLHPLPTRGGMMDSHVLKKASFRLPALASVAVLRFNTRGTSSEQGTSEGEFGGGEAERYDVAAGISYAAEAGLPGRWLLGWSFGTELALRWGLDAPPGRDIKGATLLSPPLRRAHRRRPGPLGRVWQNADRPDPRTRRLPASGRGPASVRASIFGRGDRGGRRQAPVGGGVLRAHRDERDRPPDEPPRLNPASHDATEIPPAMTLPTDLNDP